MVGQVDVTALASEMLAYLLNVPRTPQDWAVWSYAHRDQHTLIRQAIQAQTRINLTEYTLDPIDLSAFPTFLAWNQQAHNDFNGILQTQGSDLSQLNPTDPAELEAWIWLHRKEHETAAAILGLG